MKKLYIIAIISAVLAVLSAGLSLAIPTPPGQVSADFHGNLLVSILMGIPHLGAVVISMLALKGYTAQFKTAYLILFSGFAILALSFVQIPLLSILNLLASMWSTSFIGLPFLLSLVFMYVGVRGFARLFDVKSRMTSMLFLLAVVGGSIAIGTVLPHAHSSAPDETRIQLGIEMALTTLVGLAAALSQRVWRHAGALYKPALGWLTVYLAMDTVISAAYVVAILIRPENNPLVERGVLFVPYFFAGLVLLRAAIGFNEVRSAAGAVDEKSGVFSLWDRRKAAATDGQPQTPIGIVTYTASLASNEDAVDPIIDDVRILTSTMQPGASLREDQLQSLATLYRQLEDYLTQQERVRVFTRDALRQTIKVRFGDVIAAYPSFWQHVESPAATPAQPAPVAPAPAGPVMPTPA